MAYPIQPFKSDDNWPQNIPACQDCGSWPLYCECEERGKALADFVEAALSLGLWKPTETT